MMYVVKKQFLFFLPFFGPYMPQLGLSGSGKWAMISKKNVLYFVSSCFIYFKYLFALFERKLKVLVLSSKSNIGAPKGLNENDQNFQG